jgi:ketosteroid isomerase-like protein
MTYSGSLEALEAIRQLHEKYSDVTVRQDVDGYLSCYTDDGVRAGDGGGCNGKAELRAHFEGTFGFIKQMGYFCQPAEIHVTGSTATARTYTLEFIETRDGSKFHVVGEYTDDLVHGDLGWQFKRRQYRTVMTST